MIEAYSQNINVAANAVIPLNTVSVLKGTSTKPLGAGSIELTKCGIYEVTVTCVITGETTDVLGIQLQKDGDLVPQTLAQVTVSDTNSLNTIGFSTLIQVSQNSNINCPCSIPTTINVVNVGEAATINLIRINVIRI
jgi:hypothetical protein